MIQIVFPTKNSAGEKPAALSIINTVEMPEIEIFLKKTTHS